MIKAAIEKVSNNIDLTEEETREVFNEIMSGSSSHEEIVHFLKALRDKGETIDEITGAAKVMLEKAERVDAGMDLIDTCGTGGTGINTFNISTTVAFVIAGCGVRVAKHGNRSASEQCGSADVLEALGVKIGLPPAMVSKCIVDVGIGFIYAPLFHSATKHAAKPRKEIGGRTIFNILGPLSNPAMVTGQVIGVYNEKLTEILANVLKKLGLKRALVVYGLDSLDEISITDRTKVTELNSGKIRTYYISPEDLGMKRASIADIKGGTAKDNADIMLSILKGERGPRRDIVLLNAAAALVVAGKVKDIKEGIRLSEKSIDSGAALEKLERLIKLTNKI
ncbi:MAG: anthranilate phosphoribosyltransferase [Candidatus Omnitrophica bacterium]|nr:anthranilate phosphoribosyltransferase [Candidatus Omnitrophota bacterium]